LINTKPNKLDRRVVRTLKFLREAFLELMQEKQFQQITVQDITDRAMVNRATFYKHFEDKYALFNYTIKTMFQDHLEQNMPDATHLTYDNLRLLSLSTLTFLSQFIGHCAPSKRNGDLPFEKQIQSHLSGVLRQWIDQIDPLTMPANLSADLIATTTSSAIFGAIMHHARGNSSLPQEEYVEQVMTLLMNGIESIMSE
jgi:AcrR family transcriptional regulator